MINSGSQWGGKERQLVSREISVRAVRNKRLSVDDSDFERTNYREGSINGRKAWEERRKDPGLVYVCPCSKRDIRNLFRSGAARFSTLTRPSRWWVRKRHNAVRTRRKIRKTFEQSLIRAINISRTYTYICFTVHEKRDSRERAR